MEVMITNLIVAALTLMAWSMLYRENPLYGIVENLIIGFSMGYVLYTTIITLNKLLVAPLSAGKWSLIIPAILGVLLYTTFSKRYRFLSRWGIAAIAGSGAGFAVSRAVPVQILGQVKPFYMSFGEADALAIINWFIVLVTTIATMAFFTFTREHRGPLGWAAKIGRWSMMVAFGATFGATIACDLMYIIERCIFLHDAPQVYLIPIAILVVIADIIRRKGRVKA